jgi:serine/threonine protein kinase
MKCPECGHENPDSARFCSKCGVRFKAYEEISLADTRAHAAYMRRSVIGSKFADRYEILEDLGEGGMGRVYRVIDKQIDEEVALKVLRPEIAADEKTIDRFRNELKLARKISHANVCRMYHLGIEDDIPYITMEYVSGEDLGAVIRRKGRLDVKEAVTLAGQVSAGLAEAHRLGVVHRDLKPQNIMIDRAGRARILDFGIARTVETTGSTETGMFIGTPDYMSPEQVSGQHVDQRSDIYSVGIILFEMLTGRRPFLGDTPLAIALKHKTAPPPDPRELNPGIPEALGRVILKCLEKEPEKRYADGKELFEELINIEKALSPTVGVAFAQTEEKKPRSLLTARLKWAALILAAAAVVVTGALVLKAKLTAPPPEDYESFILVDLFSGSPKDANRRVLEYAILRSLTASTKLQIFSESEFETYRQRLETKEKSGIMPVISISGELAPRVTGFEITLKMRTGGKTRTRSFECKGLSEFIDPRMGEILAFLSGNSDGLITGIEGDRNFAGIATGNMDALSSFLEGEEAWNKLD